MRIVFLNYNAFGVGGTVRATANLASELSRRGFDVTIMSVRRTSAQPVLPIERDVVLEPLVDVRSLPRAPTWRELVRRWPQRLPSILIHPEEDLYRGYSVVSDAKLLARIRALRDCTLITTTPSLNILAARFAHSSVTTIGQEHKVFEAHGEALRKEIRKAYRHLDALHCITEESAARYRQMLDAAHTQVKCIPNGTVIPAEPAESRRRERAVVAAGHLVENKGMDRVIRAFALCAERFPDWRLEIYGKGPEEEVLSRQIVDAGLHNRVFLCGETDDLPAVLRTSAIFALGSHHESFGMVLIEAMAQGLPCVAFDSEGPRALVAEGKVGHVVPQGDVEAFASALAGLMEDEERRARMGEAARRSVERYDIQAIGAEWEQWLRQLHDRSSPRHEGMRSSRSESMCTDEARVGAKIAGTDLHEVRSEDERLVVSLRVTVRERSAELPLEVVLRSRRGGTSRRCEVLRMDTSKVCSDTIQIDLAFAVPHSALHDGIWDAWLRVDGEEARIRTNRNGSEYPSLCALGKGEGARLFRPYDTSDAQLSVRVTRIDRNIVAVDRVGWDGSTFVVEGAMTNEHELDVVAVRAIWLEEDEMPVRELPLERVEPGRLRFRHDTAAVGFESPCQFEWLVRDRAGRVAWCRVGVSSERQRPFRHWILPVAGRVGPRGNLWIAPRIGRNHELVLEAISPIRFSLSKVRVRSFPAHHANVRVEMDFRPPQAPSTAAVLPEEVRDLRLTWVSVRDPGARMPAAPLSPAPVADLRLVGPPSDPTGKGDADVNLCAQFKVREREYLVPIPVDSPAARRRYDKFERAATPTGKFDGRWHAFVADGENGFTLRYIRRKRRSAEKLRTHVKDAVAAAAARVVGAVSSRPVWLVGENLGKVAQDNGVAFFEHCVTQRKPERVLFVARPDNRHWSRLAQNREHVLRHNSFAHYYYYHRAERLVVAHGIRDVLPSLYHRRVSKNQKSVVYLGHGITAMKKIYYSNDSYNGKIDAFVVSSEFERDLMVRYNRFSPSRVVVTGMPRYDSLTPLPPDGTILVMPTWREWYMDSVPRFTRSAFYSSYRALLTDPDLLRALRDAGMRVRFYPHIEIERRFGGLLDFASDVVDVCSYATDEVQSSLRKCSALVTDYSSVAWDAIYMGKPVFFFHFDRDEYEERRGSYVDLRCDLPGTVVEDTAGLVAALGRFLRGEQMETSRGAEIVSRYYAYRDRNNAERVYRAVRRLRTVP